MLILSRYMMFSVTSNALHSLSHGLLYTYGRNVILNPVSCNFKTILLNLNKSNVWTECFISLRTWFWYISECQLSTYGLCLPVSVDHGTSALTDGIVVPLPRLWVDRLPNGTQNPQAGEVIPGGGRGGNIDICHHDVGLMHRSGTSRWLTLYVWPRVGFVCCYDWDV